MIYDDDEKQTNKKKKHSPRKVVVCVMRNGMHLASDLIDFYLNEKNGF
jgi:hypothetical protein